jgi:hypothetical protein
VRRILGYCGAAVGDELVQIKHNRAPCLRTGPKVKNIIGVRNGFR